MSRVLQTLRVLDLGAGRAARGVGMVLADLGADVIRLDPRHGDGDGLDAVLDRGKRCARMPAGDEAAHRRVVALAAAADVLITDQDAAWPRSLGFDPGRLQRDHPHLVQLSVPGFSRLDEARAHLPSDDGLVSAAAGLYRERGLNNALRGYGPGFVPLSLASGYAIAFATIAVLVALIGRSRDGRGESLEVPLYNALLEGLAYNHIRIAELPPRYEDRRARALGGTRAPIAPDRLDELIDPLYRSYRCADGRYFYVAMPPHTRLIRATLSHLGMWEALIADGLPTDDAYEASHRWRSPAEGSILGLPKLADRWLDRLRRELAERFAAKRAQHFEEDFARHGLVGVRVRSTAEWMDDPHARESGLLIEVCDPVRGAVVQPGPIAWFPEHGGAPPEARSTIAADDLEWRPRALTPFLAETPAASAEPPLRGITVLDLTNVIAGPTVAGTLARFGADVIKVDPCRPNFDPFITVVLGLQAGRGKRSMLLDITSPAGREAWEKLIARADLVTFNGPTPQLHALGLDIASLRALNPRTGLVQVTAFGGPRPGAMSAVKGFDEVLQAATGLMQRVAGEAHPPEEYAQFGTVDVVTGLCGAVGALASILLRMQTGHGEWSATSLAAGAGLVQLPYLSGSPPPPGGPLAMGEDALHRIYRCRDDYLYIAAEPGAQPRLAALFGIDPDLPPAPFELALERAMATLPIEQCTARLDAAGAPHHRLETFERLRDRHRLDEREAGERLPLCDAAFVRHRTHPIGDLELVAQCAVRTSRRPIEVTAPHPRYGAHTREVLLELGYAKAEVDALIERGAAAERWPGDDRYLPR
jgi:crotonobetainyl-CoA:carnitine CoA-transferase CaiB-like acyl-CoA transferase